MARSLFGIEKGIQLLSENLDTGVKILFGSGAPSIEAEVGSKFLSTDGMTYTKKTVGTGTDKWVRDANADDLLAIKFRSEKVVVATGDVAPSSPSTIDLVVNPFGDDEGTKIIASDFVAGDHVIFGVGGTPVLMKVTLVSGDEITVASADDALSAQDKFVVQNYLPDSPNDQEKQAIVEYTGTAIIKLGDLNWNFADGIGLSVSYTPASGNITNADTVNSAIQKLDGNIDALNTLSGMGQGATDLDAFSGTIIPDDSDIKEALQALETAIESIDNESSLDAVTTEQVLDEVLVDNVKAVVWDVWASLDSAPAQVMMGTISALHDGTVLADAANVDDSLYAKLKLGAEFNKTIAVKLSGVTTAQKMQLTVAATAAVSFRSIRRNVY